ncbi:hypothetical protein Lal_00021765 [Lupinus albus]|nr:hypothetical protein Lal_00021765 [Lupinus albus]
MDNSALQSQGSLSSVSQTNQIAAPQVGSHKTGNRTEFVNHELTGVLNCGCGHDCGNVVVTPIVVIAAVAMRIAVVAVVASRQHWVGNKKPEARTQQLREPKLSWNATYEGLLGNNKPFRQPIPLSEMVDFLVDIWEQEGLYD